MLLLLPSSTTFLYFHSSSLDILHIPPHHLGRAEVTTGPLRLAPVSGTAEIVSATAEVGSGAAKSSLALLVDNRPASLALGSIRTPGCSRLSRSRLGVTLSVASLATVTAVEILVLDVVLGAAVTVGGAAAVEVAVGSGTGAGNTALGTAADVNDGDGSGEGLGGGGRSGDLGGGLHGGRGLGGARGASGREGLQAGGGIAVVLGATAL